MQDFYKLQKQLFVVTLAFTGIIFISVWIFYSLNIALNYLIGAIAGVVYLRMLAKDVERIGQPKDESSKNRLAVFIGWCSSNSVESATDFAHIFGISDV